MGASWYLDVRCFNYWYICISIPHFSCLIWGLFHKGGAKGGGDFTSTAELKSVGQGDKITVYNTCCRLKGL